MMKDRKKEIQNIIRKVVNKKNYRAFQKAIVSVSIITMLLHASLIFLAHKDIVKDEFLANQNYLAAIATPFTFILMYEIFLLVLSVSKSIPLSLGRQYEIIALVLIRDIFKVLSEVDYNKSVDLQSGKIEKVVQDIFFSIILFGLIIGYFATMKFAEKEYKQLTSSQGISQLKKISSFLLTIIFGIFMLNFVIDISQAENTSELIHTFKAIPFLGDLFIVMIFADVTMLLITFYKNHDFETVFYVSVLIAASILIRFALFTETPTNGIIAIVSVVIGIAVNILYYLNCRRQDLLKNFTPKA